MRFLTANDNIPTFNEHGLGLSRAWRDIDLDKLSPEARDMLEVQFGRLIQVSELDAEAFAAACAPLEVFEGKLRYPVGTDLDTVSPIGRRWQLAAAAPAAKKPKVDAPAAPAADVAKADDAAPAASTKKAAPKA